MTTICYNIIKEKTSNAAAAAGRQAIMINMIEKLQNNDNETGATISIWYYVHYQCGRKRYFKKLPKSAIKFLSKAEITFQSVLSPKGYQDTKGITRGNPEAACSYGETQFWTIFEREATEK